MRHKGNCSDIIRGSNLHSRYQHQPICIGSLWRCTPGDPRRCKSLREACASVYPGRCTKSYQGALVTPSFAMFAHNPNKLQAYCSEAATLKRLAHPNIAPLLGITFKPFQLISGWFPFDLPRYIEKDPDADRLQLVGVLLRFSSHSYPSY